MQLKRTVDEMMKRPQYQSNEITADIIDYIKHLYSFRSTDIPDEIYKINEIYRNPTYNKKNYRFQIGRFYLFNYMYENLGKVKKTIDIRPMVFVLDEISEKNIIKLKGFNLNFMDKQSRIIFMDIYFQIFNRVMGADLQKLEEYQNLNLYQYSRFELDFFFEQIHKYFPNISNAIRYWDIMRIVDNSVIYIRPQDYNILYEFTGFMNSIKGETWSTIQNKMIR